MNCFGGIKAGILVLSALIGIVGMTRAQTGDSFGVVKNPIELWSGEIARAEKSALVATYKFSSKEALEALLAARKRGISVTLLIDGVEAAKSAAQVKKARASGIEIFIWNTEASGEFHAKFTVVDEKILIIGSFNLSKAAAGKNTESFLFTRDSTLVGKAVVAFEGLLNKSEKVP